MPARTPGAADAVNVHVEVARDVVVDHRVQCVDVQAARGHVSCDEHGKALVGELHQGAVTVALFQIAVQGQHAEATAAQLAGDGGTLLTCVAEHHGGIGPLL